MPAIATGALMDDSIQNTLGLLIVSPQTYDEIAAILRRLNAFDRLASDGVIDMRGLGLVRLETRAKTYPVV
jgi:hypothetical protein